MVRDVLRRLQAEHTPHYSPQAVLARLFLRQPRPQCRVAPHHTSRRPPHRMLHLRTDTRQRQEASHLLLLAVNMDNGQSHQTHTCSRLNNQDLTLPSSRLSKINMANRRLFKLNRRLHLHERGRRLKAHHATPDRLHQGQLATR